MTVVPEFSAVLVPEPSPGPWISDEWRAYIRDVDARFHALGVTPLAVARAAFTEPWCPLAHELFRLSMYASDRSDQSMLERSAGAYRLAKSTNIPMEFLMQALLCEREYARRQAEARTRHEHARMREAWREMADVAARHGFKVVSLVEHSASGGAHLRHDTARLRPKMESDL